MSGHLFRVAWKITRANIAQTQNFNGGSSTPHEKTSPLKNFPTSIEALRWLRREIPGAARIYMPGCSAEATPIVDAFQAEPTLAENLTFLGIWIPGINKVDYAGLHPTARSEQIFITPASRDSYVAGDVSFLPLSYSQAFPWLEQTPLDAAIFHLSTPDENGLCSFGVSNDFSQGVAARKDILKIGVLNREMPRPATSDQISIDSLDGFVELTHPLIEYLVPSLAEAFEPLADHITTLVPDGATLQFGLGNVQLAVLKALTHKQQLRIHSGMVSDPLLHSLDTNIFAKDDHAITTGVALGTHQLYERITAHRSVRFAPVSHTHDIETLGKIENFIAINSVIEVDLWGQANAEWFGNNLVSGTGGLVDFLRGAHRSRNGKPVCALLSTARNGKISRIVPQLKSPSTSIARADMGIVVTEYGVAELRGQSTDARAEALINIAHPDHRATLRNAWACMKENPDDA